MKRAYGPKMVILAWALGFLTAALGLGVAALQLLGGADGAASALKYGRVYTFIRDEYIGQADMQQVSDAAFSAMVAETGDRWSFYMTASQYEDYLLYQENSYRGIGVTITAHESGYQQVAELVEGSPAMRAGVCIGDLLLELDGKDLLGLDAAAIKQHITEKSGQEFTLTVKHNDGTRQMLTVCSETIYSSPVKYEMLPDDIGYVRVKNFETGAGQGIVDAVDELEAQKAQGIVIDLRANPGGLLSELMTALDHLLPEGDVFVSMSRDGEQSVKRSDGEYTDVPLCVLVDESTFSAAEFFAAALSEYQRAVIVGERTTGKSRSQVNLMLPDGSALHLSTNGYLTPERADLSEQGGLVPNVQCALEEELKPYLRAGMLEPERDAQLQEAVKVLSPEDKAA